MSKRIKVLQMPYPPGSLLTVNLDGLAKHAKGRSSERPFA